MLEAGAENAGRAKRLDGRVVIVTGGARGMGESHVRTLAGEGAKVVCTDILANDGAALAAELGDSVCFAHHDVTNADSWRHVVDLAEARFGPVAVLVNNAGVLDVSPIGSTTEAAFRRVIDVNLVGTFLGMQAVIPSLRKAGGGSIVNVSSVAGFAASVGLCAYVASKFAIRGMTKVAALEFGKDNVRVNSVHPGGVATPMTAGLPELDQLPIPRMGRPVEVSRMIAFLASDESSYCTGSEFIVDGGFLTVVGQQTL